MTDERCKGPWKCFFCGEVFPDAVTAGRHFGEPEGCELPVPGCVDPLRRDEKARLHQVQLANYEARRAIEARDAADEKNERLRAALKPFSDAITRAEQDEPTSYANRLECCRTDVTLYDFAQARTAYEQDGHDARKT